VIKIKTKRSIIYVIIIIIRDLMNILEDLDNFNIKTLNKLKKLLNEIYNKLHKN